MKRLWTLLMLSAAALPAWTQPQPPTPPTPPVAPTPLKAQSVSDDTPTQLRELARQVEQVRADNKALREELNDLKGRLSNLPPALLPEKLTPRDVTVRNEDYTVGENEVVAGNVRTVNGNLAVRGAVRGDASTVNGNLDVTGLVSGNVATVSGDLRLGPQAVVKGDVQVVNGSLHRDPAAQVGGSIQRVGGGRHVPGMGDDTGFRVESAMWKSAMPLWAVMVFLLAGMVLLAAMPRRVDTVGRAFVNRPGESFFLGLISVPALALAFFLSLITVVGPVLLVFGYVSAFVMGVCAMALMLGRRMVLGRPYRSRFYPLTVGLGVWFLASAVSHISTPLLILVTVSTFIAYAMAIGAALTTGFGKSPYWLRDRFGNRRTATAYADPSQTYAGATDPYGDMM